MFHQKSLIRENIAYVKVCANDIIKKRHTSSFTFYQIESSTIKWGKKMKPKIVKSKGLNEYLTPEHCFIAENYSAKQVSIARARVKPGITTVSHHLIGVKEIYIITSGKGKVKVGNMEPTEVEEGDVVVIPPRVSQKITNIGNVDLVFYCVCTPRFTENCYCNEESEKERV